MSIVRSQANITAKLLSHETFITTVKCLRQALRRSIMNSYKLGEGEDWDAIRALDDMIDMADEQAVSVQTSDWAGIAVKPVVVLENKEGMPCVRV